MKHELNFYKDDGTWYADIEGVSKDDNEMVFGSDSLLDLLSKDGKTCKLTVSDDMSADGMDSFDIQAVIVDHDSDGGSYLVVSNYTGIESIDGGQFWICNVTHKVFGDHPNMLWIKIES